MTTIWIYLTILLVIMMLTMHLSYRSLDYFTINWGGLYYCICFHPVLASSQIPVSIATILASCQVKSLLDSIKPYVQVSLLFESIQWLHIWMIISHVTDDDDWYTMSIGTVTSNTHIKWCLFQRDCHINSEWCWLRSRSFCCFWFCSCFWSFTMIVLTPSANLSSQLVS